MAIWNMASHHLDFQSRLNDAEKLCLYAQSVASHYHTLNASLAKVESLVEHWEKETKEGATSVNQEKKEMDEVKQKAMAAHLLATSIRDSKARVEANLTKALNSLAVAEEGGRRLKGSISRLKAKLARLDADQASLLLELEASKGEVSSLHAHVEKDREDMVKDY